MQSLRRLTVLLLLAAVSVFGIVSTAGASVPPGGDTGECSVYQYIYPGSTLKMEQHVYNCQHETMVNEVLYFQRGSTVLKQVSHDSLDCRSSKNTLSTCIKDFEYSFTNPAGSQTWTVCAEVTWYSPFGVISTYKNCYSRKL